MNYKNFKKEELIKILKRKDEETIELKKCYTELLDEKDKKIKELEKEMEEDYDFCRDCSEGYSCYYKDMKRFERQKERLFNMYMDLIDDVEPLLEDIWNKLEDLSSKEDVWKLRNKINKFLDKFH